MVFQEIRTYWGRSVAVVSNSVTIHRELDRILPPATTSSARPDTTFTLLERKGGFTLCKDETELWSGQDECLLWSRFEFHFQVDLGCCATSVVFVHAGVVALDQKGLLLPGRSTVGKSTLVYELVQQGATYYSDEYAVIDEDGWVHPFQRAINLRRMSGMLRVCPSAPKSNLCTSPCRAVLLASIEYRSGGSWRFAQSSQGEGVTVLLANAISARRSPERDLRYLARALAGAQVITGTRGEAREAAQALIQSLSADTSARWP
jgi:hypothetical protein